MIFSKARRSWATCAVLLSTPGLAMANSQQFDIPAEPLASALKAFAAQAHVQLFYVYSVIANARGNAVRGQLDTREALGNLLRDTGLEAVYTSDAEVTIRRSNRPQDAGSQAPAAGDRAGAKDPATSQGDAHSLADPPSGGQLQEVIVTAQKREQRLADVPIPVTAISAPTLAQRNQYRLEDYYSQIPGLSLTPNEFGGEATIAIRGITTGDFTNPNVGITVDGVPFGPSTSVGGGQYAPDLDPSDLARIEVLRGPQGTLYGASSMGGLVNYVTQDPSTARTSGRLEVGLSTVHNGPATGYNASGMVNIPLSDTLALRASGFTRQEPGYVQNIRSGQRGVNKVVASGAHLAALWRPSDAFSLKLSAFFQNNQLRASPYVTLGEGLGDLQQDLLPNTGGVRRKLQAYSAIATGKVGTFTLTSVTGYSVSELQDSLDYSQVLGTYLLSSPFQTYNTLDTDNTHTDKFSQEIRLETPIGTHFDWLLGGFYTHEYSPWTVQIIPVTADSLPFGLFGQQNFFSAYNEEAAFTDLTYHVTHSFDIQLGGRASQILQTYQELDTGLYVNELEGTTSPAVTPESVLREHAYTYLVTPKWKVSPNLMIYVRLASGFRPGGINVGNLAGAPPVYQPDKTYNYEIGAKGSAFDERLSFDASLYYIDWKSIELSLINQANGQNYFANGSEAKSQGIELSAQAAPINGLHLGGWVTFSDAVLTQNMPANGSIYGMSGDRLPYSSRFSANGSADYSFPVGSLIGTVGADVSYVGSRIGAIWTSSDRQYLPAYAKTDLHASVQTGPWTVDTYLNNVMDRRGLTGGGLGTAYPNEFGVIQPRTFGLSVARTF